MPVKMSSLLEPLPTLLAFILPLASVRIEVCVEGALPAEFLPAFLTLVFALPGVSAGVCREVAFPLVCLPALLAGIVPLPGVCAAVIEKSTLAGKAPTTLFTLNLAELVAATPDAIFPCHSLPTHAASRVNRQPPAPSVLMC